MSNLLNRLATRVAAASVTADGAVVGRGCVLRGLHYNDAGGGQPGTVILRDGGSSGEVKLMINTPGGGVGMDVSIPAGGIVFSTNMYAALTQVDDITVFYE